jgi:hypothetical protein
MFWKQFIAIVYHAHSAWKLSFEALEHDNRAIMSMEHYDTMFLESKFISREKNSKRRLDEWYLGKLSFSVELLRSFNEFLAVVVKMFGFKPYEFKYSY